MLESSSMRKNSKEALFDTEQKEDWKKRKNKWNFFVLDDYVCFCILPCFYCEDQRSVEIYQNVGQFQFAKKQQRIIAWHREERGLERNFCPAWASLCRWSEPLLTWLWPEEEHMNFSNLLHTWVCQHWYTDFSKLLHGFVEVVLYISHWCLCQWSEPLLTWLWEEEEEADW